jgi:hypothetical protein
MPCVPVVVCQLPEPRFDGLEQMAADVEDSKKTWSTYKDFQTELVSISVQDWISFRARIFELQVSCWLLFCVECIGRAVVKDTAVRALRASSRTSRTSGWTP